MISNGYIQEKPLRELCRHITGVKIDLKAFTESFYKEQCNGELAPVLKTLETPEGHRHLVRDRGARHPDPQ